MSGPTEGSSKRRQYRTVNRRLVTDNKFVERAGVALPRQEDQLLIRHTPYRPFNSQTGWVSQQHAEKRGSPRVDGLEITRIRD